MKKKYKYFPIKPEDIEAAYNVEVEAEKSVPFIERWIEYKGKKFYCTKIANEEWHITEIDDFPFYKLPADFDKLKKIS